MEFSSDSFSIREYVMKMRSVDVARCWPFDEQILGSEGGREKALTQLPEINVRKFRWWSSEIAGGKERSETSSRINQSLGTTFDGRDLDTCGGAQIRKTSTEYCHNKDLFEAAAGDDAAGCVQKQIETCEGASPPSNPGNAVPATFAMTDLIRRVEASGKRAKTRAPKKRSIVEIFADAVPVLDRSCDHSMKAKKKIIKKKLKSKMSKGKKKTTKKKNKISTKRKRSDTVKEENETTELLMEAFPGDDEVEGDQVSEKKMESLAKKKVNVTIKKKRKTESKLVSAPNFQSSISNKKEKSYPADVPPASDMFRNHNSSSSSTCKQIVDDTVKAQASNHKKISQIHKDSPTSATLKIKVATQNAKRNPLERKVHPVHSITKSKTRSPLGRDSPASGSRNPNSRESGIFRSESDFHHVRFSDEGNVLGQKHNQVSFKESMDSRSNKQAFEELVAASSLHELSNIAKNDHILKCMNPTRYTSEVTLTNQDGGSSLLDGNKEKYHNDTVMISRNHNEPASSLSLSSNINSSDAEKSFSIEDVDLNQPWHDSGNSCFVASESISRPSVVLSQSYKQEGNKDAKELKIMKCSSTETSTVVSGPSVSRSTISWGNSACNRLSIDTLLRNPQTVEPWKKSENDQQCRAPHVLPPPDQMFDPYSSANFQTAYPESPLFRSNIWPMSTSSELRVTDRPFNNNDIRPVFFGFQRDCHQGNDQISKNQPCPPAASSFYNNRGARVSSEYFDMQRVNHQPHVHSHSTSSLPASQSHIMPKLNVPMGSHTETLRIQEAKAAEGRTNLAWDQFLNRSLEFQKSSVSSGTNVAIHDPRNPTHGSLPAPPAIQTVRLMGKTVAVGQRFETSPDSAALQGSAANSRTGIGETRDFYPHGCEKPVDRSHHSSQVVATCSPPSQVWRGQHAVTPGGGGSTINYKGPVLHCLSTPHSVGRTRHTAFPFPFSIPDPQVYSKSSLDLHPSSPRLPLNFTKSSHTQAASGSVAQAASVSVAQSDRASSNLPCTLHTLHPFFTSHVNQEPKSSSNIIGPSKYNNAEFSVATDVSKYHEPVVNVQKNMTSKYVESQMTSTKSKLPYQCQCSETVKSSVSMSRKDKGLIKSSSMNGQKTDCFRRPGPMKLSGGARHILRPSEMPDRRTSLPTHSTVQFSSVPDPSKREGDMKKKNSMIYQF